MYIAEFLNEGCCEILVQSIEKKNNVELSLLKYNEGEEELQLLSSIDIDFQPTETILDSYLFHDITSPVLVVSSIDSKYYYYNFQNHKIQKYNPTHSFYTSINSTYVVKMQIYKENDKMLLILAYEDGSLLIINTNEYIYININKISILILILKYFIGILNIIVYFQVLFHQ